MMRSDLPYAPPVNGRWYKVFLENDKGLVKITTSDIDCKIIKLPESGFLLAIDKKYKLLTYMIEPVLNLGDTGVCTVKLEYSDGECVIDFDHTEPIDNVTLYVYCVRV